MTRSDMPWRLWEALAAVTVVGALLSLVPLQQAGGEAVPCGNSSPQCDGTCPPGQICAGESRGMVVTCVCRQLGCCRLANNSCSDDATALECIGNGGVQFVGNGSCAVECLPPTATPTETPTASPTITPSPTATPTKVPNGGTCMDPTDCVSGDCVDNVCIGAPAPAPAASRGGLLAIALVLTGIAALAFWRRQRR